MASLDLQGARKDMVKALAMKPNHPLAIRTLYTIDKTEPQSEEYHQSAQRLLSYLMRGNEEDLPAVFEEYRQLSGKPRITAPLLSRLVDVYLKKKNLKGASSCLARLIKTEPAQPDIPGNLLRLAHAYREAKQKEAARNCLNILAKKYGNSSEGMEAHQILGQKS